MARCSETSKAMMSLASLSEAALAAAWTSSRRGRWRSRVPGKRVGESGWGRESGRGRAWRCTGRLRPARGTRPARRAARSRQSDDEMASAGISTRSTRSGGLPFEHVGVHGVAGAACSRRSRPREKLVDVAPGEDVGQRVGAGDEVELGIGPLTARSRSVSIVYVGPARSMSMRDTRNSGFEAVAITVIR